MAIWNINGQDVHVSRMAMTPEIFERMKARHEAAQRNIKWPTKPPVPSPEELSRMRSRLRKRGLLPDDIPDEDVFPALIDDEMRLIKNRVGKRMGHKRYGQRMGEEMNVARSAATPVATGIAASVNSAMPDSARNSISSAQGMISDGMSAGRNAISNISSRAIGDASKLAGGFGGPGIASLVGRYK